MLYLPLSGDWIPVGFKGIRFQRLTARLRHGYVSSLFPYGGIVVSDGIPGAANPVQLASTGAGDKAMTQLIDIQ